jgi:hypothetical protein
MSHASDEPRLSRYPIQLPLLYWRKSPARTRAGAGWTQELSEEGATVELAERLEPQMLLRVRIQTNRGPIEMEAKVVWIGAPAPPSAGHHHGLAFTQIAPDQLQALQDLLLPLSMIVHIGMRVPVDLAVTCREKSPGGLLLRGRAGDVSRGGLLLRLREAIAPGSMVEITLHAATGPITLEGAIMWAQPPERRKSGELIDHGLRFTSSTWSVSLALGFLLAEPR